MAAVIGLVVVGYIVLMWSTCAIGGAADDIMEAWAAREQEAEAVSE